MPPIASVTPLKKPIPKAMENRLQRMRATFTNAPYPSHKQRVSKLLALKKAVLRHEGNLIRALNSDYGRRSAQDTLIADILPIVTQINYTLRKLKRWMRAERRHTGLLFFPAKAEVFYQPLGVVGIIVPWNFPVMLSLGPLVSAIAAGNRAMLKMSEFTPHTNEVLQNLLEEVFDDLEVAVIEGDAEVAESFSRLAFDHMCFTGSTAVGRHVMRAAANNLTPVTLELGGKSPVVIAPDMDIDLAVSRLIYGKSMNSGQICIAPDYILCPEHQVSALVKSYSHQFQNMYPLGCNSQDYSAIINQRHLDRLQKWLNDGKDKGAQVIPAAEPACDESNQIMVTHLLLNPSDEMTLMREEIFGPVLPIVAYRDIDEALAYINARPRPLALYLMSLDSGLQQRFAQQTHSGALSCNDTLFHVAVEDVPFGGVGDSGMGHYHGREGFLTFSKAKTLFKRSKLTSGDMVKPPYGTFLQKIMLCWALKRWV